jgi:hypothetical protein
MEFKVRAIDSTEQKSVQETEADLLAKHEASLDDDGQDSGQDGGQDEVPATVELKEDEVLNYIGKRYNKQINSFDELMAERKEATDMPEDVAAYMKFKKETGRGFEDFIKLNKDYNTMDSDVLLKEYLSATQDGLDEEDIESLMEDYTFDEDIDDDSKIKRVKIAKKKAVAEAKKFFTEQQGKYKVPLESRMASLPDEEREEYDSYKQYTKQAKTIEEENTRKRSWFDQKTNDLFSNDFKGFDFNIDNKKFTFTPGEAAELKKAQATPSNFITKFLDENGLIKDAAGYHRSLAMAMHPEKFAKFFYEQGQSDATNDVMRKTKNINMSTHRAPEVTTTGGMQVKAVNPDSGRSLKIHSSKKLRN